MTIWAVVPIKAPAACKTRLAPALAPEARVTLVAQMLSRVLDAVSATAAINRIMLLGPHDWWPLPSRIEQLDDPGGGLNAALDAARAAALEAGARRLIVLPADLPWLEPADVDDLAKLDPGIVGIAPDREGTGTNALSLPLPAAASYAFHFGGGSRAGHVAEAARLDLAVSHFMSRGLATDIDEPADLAAMRF